MRDAVGDLGPHDHPDVTLDCIALARTVPAWNKGDYAAVGADFFACPDNTAHLAPEQPRT